MPKSLSCLIPVCAHTADMHAAWAQYYGQVAVKWPSNDQVTEGDLCMVLDTMQAIAALLSDEGYMMRKLYLSVQPGRA